MLFSIYRYLMKHYIFFLLLTFLFAPAPAFASECLECGKRKQALCAKECVTVPLDKVKSCQSDCLHEYCAHKCGLEEKTERPKSRELESLFSNECEVCREQQFNRCDAECPSGSDYTRASCKLGCATVDCIDVCSGESYGTPQK
jgi:hypothetical protein